MSGASGGTPPPARAVCPVLVGPTAAGKTALVLRLAAALPIEVISLDSRQIYRGLRIGTAQPTDAEQATCRHHLVDFLPPEDRYSAQRFRADFSALWPEITARGRQPVLVGGAGLYLRAVTVGFFALPAASEADLPAVRAEIAALADDALGAELRRVDPVAAARLHVKDRYRRRRALEVYRLAGVPWSELAARQQPDPALGLDYPIYHLSRPVAELDGRIAARTDAMLAAGWLEETRELLRRHAPDCPGLRSLGYAEIVRHLAGDLPADQLAPAIVTATRRYAKRQRTWFRRVAAEIAAEPEDPALLAAVMAAVRRGLGD